MLPPLDVGAGGYFTEIADVGGAMIERIDVEKVLAEVVAREVEPSAAALAAIREVRRAAACRWSMIRPWRSARSRPR
ncbi:MAG: hypothetical protein AMXMBFR26_06020 [Porticoccaceae bacterium]